MKLQGQVCLITGAASGIGKAIASKFAAQGGKIAIADLNQDAAETVAYELRQSGAAAISIPMDVTDENQVNAGVASLMQTWGRVDVLVSNAGTQYVQALEHTPFSEWKKILAIHLDGAFLTTRACLPPMYASGRGGAILYMGSVQSKLASVLKAPYVTAKHGLIGLAQTVAREGAAHGVRTNVICPGFVRTALVEKQIPQQAQALGISEEQVVREVMLKHTVDGEFTTTEDVAEVALMFASFGSNALTGQSLVVSHGWFMQ
jgi:3-hydroxybutyrate dehydrogenase